MAKVVKMQKRRLLKLAKMLQDDAKNENGIQFDIGTVGRPSEIGVLFDVKQPVEISCGTTACAMGLAAISGKFKKDGLSYKIDHDISMNQIVPKWKGRPVVYDEAAMRLFGITSDQANYLFCAWRYPDSKKKGAAGEREVVRRIKRVVEGKKIPTQRY